MSDKEIDVLVRRIILAFDTLYGRYVGFYDEERVNDAPRMFARYHGLGMDHSFMHSDFTAREEWLRGMLAEAFGGREDQ